jgi:hypothetical protein
MKWVKCVNKLGYGVTYGKIYEVANYYDWNGQKFLELIDDDGRITTYDMFQSHPNNRLWFEDATAEVMANERDNKLKQLGI